MKEILIVMMLLGSGQVFSQQKLYMPQNVAQAFKNNTRSADGKPGSRYWQNGARYTIDVTTAPPDRTVRGTETITYFNNSPDALKSLVIKLIINIHKPGAGRLSNASADYLTTGIKIDKFTEAGAEKKMPEANGTWQQVRLTNPLPAGDSIKISFEWHYELSQESGREGRLDSTSFFLAYFYPRVAVMDDVDGTG